MSLRTIVKAGNISNLSDARYCAGMGVEIIGFSMRKSDLSALDPSKIKEIMGWLAGVKFALELGDGTFENEEILDIIQNLNPDFFQIPYHQVKKMKEITNLPLLIESHQLEKTEGEDILLYTGERQNDQDLSTFCKNNKVILSFEVDADQILALLETLNPYGIELKGGTEISPGLNDFDELSKILELLEVEE